MKRYLISIMALTVTSLIVFLSPNLLAVKKQDLSKYIGLVYPPLEDDLVQLSGTLVSNPYDDKIPYYIAVIEKGDQEFLWFSKAFTQSKNSVLSRQVIDVMPMPKYGDGKAFVTLFCRLNDEEDREIFAVCKDDGSQYFTHILKAWRANKTTEKFESISTKGIVCENMGYGL